MYTHTLLLPAGLIQGMQMLRLSRFFYIRVTGVNVDSEFGSSI